MNVDGSAAQSHNGLPDQLPKGGTHLRDSNYSSYAPPRESTKKSKLKYPRLSRPVPMIRPEYDVVVVGSGYGGGVAASRMARAGKSVAILELGKEKWPGEYPASLKDVALELHVSGNVGRNSDSGQIIDVALGNKTGLYNLVIGTGQNAFVGHGLGGTSLINANVFLHADKRSLALPNWPPELRHDPAALDAYYDRAAKVLQPQTYPESYPPLRKLQVLEHQAQLLGKSHNFYRVPQTTFFYDGINSTGVEMNASTGSGQDSTGVNDGSKHSVLMNYIPDAWNWGAEIFCECEVRYVHRIPAPSTGSGGYIVFFAWHGGGRRNFKDAFYDDLMWVKAKEICFLAAGALGTTEILLRSRARGLKMSHLVGQKVSGNGDALSFGYNTDEIVNGVGQDNSTAEIPCGPTITGVIDNRDELTSPNVFDGHVIEEGVIPQALAYLLQPMLDVLPASEKASPDPYPLPLRFRRLVSRVKNTLNGPYAAGSSINRTQTYLVMSHDSNEGVITVDRENDKPYLHFPGVGRTEHVKELNARLAKMTSGIGGTFVNSPFYTAFGELTVHPLGGAIMSSDGTGEYGVTNHIGQVFTGDGKDVYEGLVCVDGSIIPTALGVNPFATITALAERAVDFIASRNGWTIDVDSHNRRLDLFGKPDKSYPLPQDIADAQKAIAISSSVSSGGIRFSEILEGYIHIGTGIDDFDEAENVAKQAASLAKFHLTVDSHSVRNVVVLDDHASIATGIFSCSALSGDPLLVLRGQVQFFAPDSGVSDATNIVYNLMLLSTSGETYLLQGYKMVDSSIAFSIRSTWKATTVLYTTISRPDGTLVGRGKLHISWRNFESTLKSFCTTGVSTLERARAATRFLGYFAYKVADYFVGPFRRLEYPQSTTTGYLVKTPPKEMIILTARDGVQTKLRYWEPSDRMEMNRKSRPPLLLVPGSSVDHQVFAMPTIQVNAVEYFTSLGFSVYVLVTRFGFTSTAKEGFTAYDGRLDVRAAMDQVHSRHPGEKMYIVCHCVGSMATCIGLLDGTLSKEHILGMTVSQVFFRPQFGRINDAKAATQLLTKLYSFLAGSPWFPAITSPSSSTFQFIVDQILRFYPVGPKREICNSSVCHRSSLVFGRCWSHGNLTHSTHSQLENFMGGVHITLLSHLMRMGRNHTLMTNDGTDLGTWKNIERMRGIPILFFSGGDNVVYDPVSTSWCYEELRERFGTLKYRRFVASHYGHLDGWMGKRAYLDVYPHVGNHVFECAKGAFDE